jgi:hypothetical protein
MATSLGKAGYLLLSAVTALELRNYALDRTSDTTEDTVIGDSWKTRKATLNDWSVSADMFWDPLDPGQSAAATGIEAGTRNHRQSLPVWRRLRCDLLHRARYRHQPRRVRSARRHGGTFFCLRRNRRTHDGNRITRIT